VGKNGMILPPVVRVFFAIDLPDNTKEMLAEYIESLKLLSKSSHIRWSRTENLHITLQFLAEVNSEHIDQMIALVEAELLAEIKHFKISLRELHLYPDPYRPRVLVVDIAPQAALASLSAKIGAGIQKAGLEIEARQFRGHMTIGRFKTVQKSAVNFLAKADAPDVGDIEINEVVLFQSVPHSDGSHYIPLRRIPLREPRL
jgi:2'-5' RNA ligase